MALRTTGPAINGAGRRQLKSWTELSDLSQERLKQFLEYNPLTGLFFWKIKPNASVNIGDQAGTKTDADYIVITIGGIRCMAHSLAWFFIFGEWTQLDHKDRNRSNNRLTNLRPANDQQNAANKSAWGSLKVKGVTKRGNKFIAQITVNYVNRYLGTFDTIEEASKAYINAARENFGEFACE